MIQIKQYKSRAEMGMAAAAHVAWAVEQILTVRQEVNIVFASATSQNEFLEALSGLPLPWGQVNAFHMDEYLGLDSFARFLDLRLFSKHTFRSVNYLNGTRSSAESECVRYAALLRSMPVDITCLGIGENTHLAFNDPHVALFDDRELVKIVTLDERSRRQQVNDGCFESLDLVPGRALTLTVPALMAARYVVAVVPGRQKAEAVKITLEEEVSEKFPSTILKTHPGVVLFLDESSSSLIKLEL